MTHQLISKNQPSRFNVVASTGRTATTFITHALTSLPGVTALHEGHALSKAETKTALLPLINLENSQCYKSPSKAFSIVEKKRSHDVIASVIEKSNANTLIDIAYYNATIIHALLETNQDLHVVGIIRNCENFVRSASRITGEDIMAVGWPAPDKPLTSREKFIAMGRIKPRKCQPEFSEWAEWGSIERNIWLWRETNNLILQAKNEFPNRVSLISFETLKLDPKKFWNLVLSAFGIPKSDTTILELEEFIGDRNRKASGYQVPSAIHWTEKQRDMLKSAETHIQSLWRD